MIEEVTFSLSSTSLPFMLIVNLLFGYLISLHTLLKVLKFYYNICAFSRKNLLLKFLSIWVILFYWFVFMDYELEPFKVRAELFGWKYYTVLWFPSKKNYFNNFASYLTKISFILYLAKPINFLIITVLLCQYKLI